MKLYLDITPGTHTIPLNKWSQNLHAHRKNIYGAWVELSKLIQMLSWGDHVGHPHICKPTHTVKAEWDLAILGWITCTNHVGNTSF